MIVNICGDLKLFKQVVLLQLTVQDLTRWLAFENAKEAAVFCDHFGLRLSDFSTKIILCKDSLHNTSHQLPVGRAVSLIERKRTCSVGEVSVEISHVCVHSHKRFVQLLCRGLWFKFHNSVGAIGGKALSGEVSVDSSSYLRLVLKLAMCVCAFTRAVRTVIMSCGLWWVIVGKALSGEVSLDSSSYLRLVLKLAMCVYIHTSSSYSYSVMWSVV